jgi:hypothetical protein
MLHLLCLVIFMILLAIVKFVSFILISKFSCFFAHVLSAHGDDGSLLCIMIVNSFLECLKISSHIILPSI